MWKGHIYFRGVAKRPTHALAAKKNKAPIAMGSISTLATAKITSPGTPVKFNLSSGARPPLKGGSCSDSFCAVIVEGPRGRCFGPDSEGTLRHGWRAQQEPLFERSDKAGRSRFEPPTSELSRACLRPTSDREGLVRAREQMSFRLR